MRILKAIAVSVAILFGLLLVAIAAITVVPGNTYKDLIGSAVKSATGRDLAIGNLDVALGSSLRLTLSDVSLANAAWGSRPQMFTGRRIEGEVALRPLLDGVLDIRLVLEAPDLALERDANGLGNWQMGTDHAEPSAEESAADDSTGRASLRPLIREVRLEQVRLTYGDAQAGQHHDATFETILMRTQGGQVQVALKGRVDEHALTMSGGIDQAIAADTESAANFNLTGELGDVVLTARGTLDALSALAHADLVIEARVPSLSALSAVAGRELPDQGPVEASLHLSGGEGHYSARDINLVLSSDLLAARIQGVVADLTGVNGIDLTVVGNTQRLTDVLQAFGVDPHAELPPQLDVEGRLQGGLQQLALSDYRVSVADKGVDISVKGQVADLMALTGIQAEMAMSAQSLAALSRYAATELPDSGPVQLSGRLNSPKGLDAPTEVSASLTADGLSAKTSGTIESPMAAKGIALAVELEGDSLEQVARLAGQEIPRKEPVKVKTQLKLGEDRYMADALQVALGDIRLDGALTFIRPAAPKARPRLEGQLHLGTLDLRALEAEPTTAVAAPAEEAAVAKAGTTDSPAAPSVVADPEAQAASSSTGEAKADRVFSSDPLPVEALRSMDADIELTADEIGTRELLLKQVTGKLTLNGGVLEFGPLQAAVGEGSLQASQVFDVSKSPATLAVNVHMKDGTSRSQGGRYGLDVDLKGAGDSVAQLMAGLDGQIIVDLRDMTLEKSVMTRFGKGLIETISPFDDKTDENKLVCAIMRFDIDNGIADAEDKIVAQLTKVTWFGGGTINLKTEALDLGAQSKPRTGLGIDTLAGLPSLVHVGGTLANPRVVPDPKGIAKTYGEGYLTVVTGGLYLLAKGLWEKGQANSDVCAEILSKRKETKTTPVVAASAGDQEQTTVNAPATDPTEATAGDSSTPLPGEEAPRAE